MQDDSKSLSYSEFASILTQTGDPLTQEEVSQFFSLVDKDQDGMLNIDEFMQVLYPPDTGAQDDSRLLTRLHSVQEFIPSRTGAATAMTPPVTRPGVF